MRRWFTVPVNLLAYGSIILLWFDYKSIDSINKRLAALDRIIQKLFEGNALGTITDERAKPMMAGYEREAEELKSEHENLSTMLEASQQTDHDARIFVDLIQKYTDIQELNATLLNELIDRIMVHEKEKDEDGNVTQRVDIHYRFIGFPLVGNARDESHLSTMLFASWFEYGLENLPRLAEENGLTDILFPASP